MHLCDMPATMLITKLKEHRKASPKNQAIKIMDMIIKMKGKLHIWSLTFTLYVNLIHVPVWSITFWHCVKMVSAFK